MLANILPINPTRNTKLSLRYFDSQIHVRNIYHPQTYIISFYPHFINSVPINLELTTTNF